MLSSSRPKSQIWLHFTCADNDKKVRCLHCGQRLSIANKSTCSLIRHMQKKHPKQQIVKKAHLVSKYNTQESKKKKEEGFFYKQAICIKKQKETDMLLRDSGKREYIPPDETLNKVASILAPDCEDYDVQFGDDDDVNVVIVEESEQDQQNLSAATLSALTSKSEKYFASPIREVISNGNQKGQVLINELKRSMKEKNLAIAKYYDSKRKQEEELHFLKKKKIQLEIMERESKLLKPID